MWLCGQNCGAGRRFRVASACRIALPAPQNPSGRNDQLGVFRVIRNARDQYSNNGKARVEYIMHDGSDIDPMFREVLPPLNLS